jgi:hypothetical protein
LLRAEWVSRVSALDLYVHELVAQRMVSIFEGRLPATDSFQRFQVPAETLNRIRSAQSAVDAAAAFDLQVRQALGRITFQLPDAIADGVRLCSSVELWNAVALYTGATEATKNATAKSLKTDLSLIVGRRNGIAHEGDLRPTQPREPLPVTRADLVTVRDRIDQIVRAIDAVIV